MRVLKITYRGFLTKYCWGDQIKKIGMECGMLGVQERFTQGFGEGNPMESNQLEDLVTDGRILVRWIFKKWDGETRTGTIWLRTGTGGGRL